jgi:aspartyl-tRNA(Asn)/glutamyl-tRNA(Gln) amidotransferase subunit A
VIGFKPTTGLISRYGMISYASSLDTPGFITSNLEVLSDAMEIQKKELEHRSHHDMALASGQPINVSVKKIGYSRKLLDKASPAIKDAYFAFIDQKKDDYEFVCIDDLIFGDIDVFDTAVSAYYIIACAEAAINLSRYDGIRYGQRGEYTSLEQMYYENRKFFGPEVKRRIALGNFVLSSEYYDAYYDKAIKIRRLIAERFEVIRQQCDVLYLPCSPKVAPTFEEVKLMTPTDSYLFDVFNIPVNLVGLPSITLPITKIDSLKVGFQFIGMTALADWSLIDFAKGLL